ncbi:MAG: alkaline shock response membrane anchor protein AmaP [Firmicutes bacterium]|nr:alkaline shock response membrane anchor protein AmaP [Bacillota bacterium]
MVKALLTALWVLAIAVLAGFLTVMHFSAALLEFAVNVLETVFANWQFSLLFAFIAGISLWLFFVQFRVVDRDPTPNSVIIQAEEGEVRIALTAIETLINQAASQVRGVREIKASFYNRNEALGVYIRTVVATEDSIPELSAQLQKVIRDHVYRIAGISIEEVKVLVENVASARSRVELR